MIEVLAPKCMLRLPQSLDNIHRFPLLLKVNRDLSPGFRTHSGRQSSRPYQARQTHREIPRRLPQCEA